VTLKLIFMGTPDFAVPVLAELIAAGHDIACVYTRAPKPKGRGQREERSPVHRFAQSAGLSVRHPASLKPIEEEAAFEALYADAAVVVAYGLILPAAILTKPRLGCFNLHASLLPRWRGAAPIQRAILAGDAETGVMAMRMEEGLDTGPVLMTERVTIGRQTYGELHDVLSRLGAELMVRALDALEKGEGNEYPQDHEGVVYAAKIEKSEARIDWTRTAPDLDRLIRAMSPMPGAWCEMKGERVKVLRAEPVAESMEGNGAPGEVLASESGTLAVACGAGALKLLTLQRAGRGPIDAAAFLRGFAIAPGECLS
jgi:methionyl-tRNA formyltransferase